MKVELKDAKVELEVGDGKNLLHINGQKIPITREVGVSLVFGEHKPKEAPKGPGLAKAKRKYGCQSPASKEKLSKSLKKYHAARRKAEQEEAKALTKKVAPSKKHLNGKSHLNGVGLHVN